MTPRLRRLSAALNGALRVLTYQGWATVIATAALVAFLAWFIATSLPTGFPHG